MPEINGKVIVITGAGSGMGEADAMLLAGHGAKVVLGDIRNDRLEALAGRITEGGGDVTYATTDVRRPEDLSLSQLQACTIECHGSHKCISQPGRACGVGLSRSQRSLSQVPAQPSTERYRLTRRISH
jgi:NAD(P)-dependent dehydrogenase (short-subunit alcohol dehydrogenase family)